MCKLFLFPIFLSLLNSLVFQEKLSIFCAHDMAGEKCSKLVFHVDLKTIVLNLSMMTSIRHFHYFSYSRANAAILFLLLGNKKSDFLIF